MSLLSTLRKNPLVVIGAVASFVITSCLIIWLFYVQFPFHSLKSSPKIIKNKNVINKLISEKEEINSGGYIPGIVLEMKGDSFLVDLGKVSVNLKLLPNGHIKHLLDKENSMDIVKGDLLMIRTKDVQVQDSSLFVSEIIVQSKATSNSVNY